MTIPIDLTIDQLEELQAMGEVILTIDVGGKEIQIDLTKHLPGKHDQADHAHGGGGARVNLAPDTGTEIGGGGGGKPAKTETFDRDKWSKIPPGDRRDKWAEIPVRQRDKMANGGKSIAAREKALLEGIPERPNTGDLGKDLSERMKQFSDRVHPEAMEKIERVSKGYDDSLKAVGVSDELRRELSMAAMDSLSAQEMESCTRQLGDHGAAHIEGNIRMATQMLDEVPGGNTPEDRAMMQTAMIFHDTGYMAPPSQMFMDEGHPRWSAEHFDANLRPAVEKALGPRAASEINHIMRTHDQTGMDWKNDPVATASRVADNLALFQKEKLPPIMRYVEGNTQLMKDLAAKKITLDECHAQMRDNIVKAKLPEKMKGLLNRGVDEVSPVSPKFALGMLGGEVSTLKWNGAGIDVHLKENKETSELNKLGDFGQRQFKKFAETYVGEEGAKKFQTDLSFEFKNKKGEVTLRGVYDKSKGFQFVFRGSL